MNVYSYLFYSEIEEVLIVDLKVYLFVLDLLLRSIWIVILDVVELILSLFYV